MGSLSAHNAPHHVVTTAQLHAAGLSKNQIKHLADSGRLFRRFDGVYAVGRPDLTQKGEWLAAVLACSDEAALSHRSAAIFRRLLEFGDGRTHVLVPYGFSGRGPEGIKLHRSRTFTPEDVEIVDHIPVTTVTGTLYDLAASGLPAVPLEGAVMQAVKRHDVDLGVVAARHSRLRRIVAKFDPLAALTQSELERAFLRLCRKHNLPEPLCQEEFGPYFADFTWHEYKLVVETDGSDHRTDERFRKDRVKDRRIRAAGYTVERFTYAEVIYEPEHVAAELRLILARRLRELAA